MLYLMINSSDVIDIIKVIIGCSVLSVVYLIYSIVLPPRNFPKNIPTIPFYVSFLGSYTELDQGQIYTLYLRDKLEEYGAVKIYFASRWNILVTKPKLLAQIFKQEDIFAKSGNQKKIPYSILSEYTGDNVISAHGKNWKLYRSLVTSGIQFPETLPVIRNSEKLINIISQEIENEKCVMITDLVQRFCLANVGEAMLGTDFQALEDKECDLHERLKQIKSQIFKPFYMNFPFFDMFPIPSRLKARNEVKNFRNYYCEKVISSQRRSHVSKLTAGYALVDALKDKLITEKQFADNAVIIMVAGHENPQLFLMSLLYVVAKYSNVQKQLREELAINGYELDPNAPSLLAIIYETLRMFPPLGQIINRCTVEPVVLGTDICIPKGVYVGYNNYGTGRDKSVWGEDADEFRPERWGTTTEEITRNYLACKSSSKLAAFHGRKRACLGEKFALYEAKVFITEIVKNFEIELDPTWKDRITSAGPICPQQLRLGFTSVNKSPKYENQ
ncbi:uncharacterized protein PRCAT00003186001 [Priceomyces carsonii]|uniref:uncharacterized protein n=1 Tax=Priceomyces carsonii TaxID=28549 RepID=UPI002EDACC96|nr:unnamed protein product [Priceomyces carsonii]